MRTSGLSSSASALLILLSMAPLQAGDITVNVPLGHAVYGFLERCEARGMLPGLRDGVRPFSRGQVARSLVRVDSCTSTERLSLVERELLGMFQREFRDALPCVPACSSTYPPVGPQGASVAGPRTHAAPPRSGCDLDDPRSVRPTLSLRGEPGELYAVLLLRQQGDLFSGMGRDRVERVWRTRMGATVFGQVRSSVGFYSSFEQGLESGTRDYITRDDVYEPRLEVPQLKGSRADYHEGKAHLVFSLPFGRLEVGKDDVSWGPGYADNLGLSANAPSMTMVRFRADYGAFRFVCLHAALRPCPARPDSPVCCGTADSSRSYIVHGMSRTLEREKYLAAHRLEVAMAPWLDVGIQETVVYGDRGPEMAYLNPVMFYWAAQSYLGDHDNLMMGLDVDVHPGRGVRAYVAYVIDDLKKLKVFSDDFANKFSLQAGMLWVDPVGIRDTDLRIEYVRIEPWIYTHKYPINTYRHFDRPLGHALGPNSDQWSVRCTRRLSPVLSLSVDARRLRHGDNLLLADGSIVNVGGDLHLGWRVDDERMRKGFLDGVLSRRTQLGVRMNWRIWPRLRLEAGVSGEWGANVALPPDWDADTTVALGERDGYGDADQVHWEFDLRYGVF